MAGRPLTRARARANARVSSEERIVEGLTEGLLESIQALRDTLQGRTATVEKQAGDAELLRVMAPDLIKALATATGILADKHALRTGKATTATASVGQLEDRMAEALMDAIPDPEQRSRVLKVLEGGKQAPVEPETLPANTTG